MRAVVIFFIIINVLVSSCKKEDEPIGSGFAGNGWLVPLDQLDIRDDNLDRIQSIDYPVYVNTTDVSISPQDEVLVYQSKNHS